MKNSRLNSKSYLDSIMNTLKNDVGLSSFLRDIGQNEFSAIRIEKTMRINDDRLAILFIVLNNSSKELFRFGLDVIDGEPCWDQVLDLRFGYGSLCQKRFIVFDGDKGFKHQADPAVDISAVRSLCSILNEFGHDFNMVKSRLEGDVFYFGKDQEFELICYRKDGSNDPIREDIERYLIWDIYYDAKDIVAHSNLARNPNMWQGLETEPRYGERSGLVYAYLDWDHNGFAIKVRNGEEAIPHQRHAFNALTVLRDHYREYEVTLESDTKEFIGFDIRIFKTPIEEFQLLSVPEKLHHIDQIVTEDYQFGDYFETLEMIVRDYVN